MLRMWLAVLALALAAPVYPQGGAPLVNVLIFSGRNNHDWQSTTPQLRQVLLDTGRFDVRVTEEPMGITSASLAPYDVIVLDYNGPRWGVETEKAVEAFVKGGKGLVAVHAASYAFSGLEILGDRHVRTGRKEPPWPEYIRMIGATWVEGPAKTGHGQLHSFKVRFKDAQHPVARGMGEWFWATDELYHNMKMEPGVRIMAAAFDDPKMNGTGKEEPILWTVNHGAGRVFHTTLGHDLAAMQESGFILSFVRGVEWAATGNVTIPPKQEPSASAVRLLLVTGGHDHDVAFYTAFQDRKRFSVTVDANPDAFGRELRDRFDVVVMYDMLQDFGGDKQRENIRAFLESGKGLVVVHHALASVNSWDWWHREVVGARYLLKPEGGKPGSTYKHDEELFIEPVAKHPVTDGISRMHFIDETYKGMWFSPGIKVLLKTDNPTSDGPVAWISPYAKSRVAVIQLGHGPEAHLHAGFQRLLTNAMSWAAGKTD